MSRRFFNYLSYAQYPFMVLALFYTIKPYIVGFETIPENFGNALIFAGLGISLSTLQDTTKAQNEFSRKIWEDPKKGKLALGMIAGMALIVIAIGLFGLFIAENVTFRELFLGCVVFGIGLIGMLKTAIEMFENHRVR